MESCQLCKKKNRDNNRPQTSETNLVLRQRTLSKRGIAKTFDCKFCKRTVTDNWCLRNYHKYCDPSTEKPIPCPHCEKRFVQNTHLQDHIHIHSETKPFKCGICGAGFTRVGHLRRHVKNVPHLKYYIREGSAEGGYELCAVCGLLCDLEKHSCDDPNEKEIVIVSTRSEVDASVGEGPLDLSVRKLTSAELKNARNGDEPPTANNKSTNQSTAIEEFRLLTHEPIFSHQEQGLRPSLGFPAGDQLSAQTKSRKSLTSQYLYTCKVCGSMQKTKARLREHVEFVHCMMRTFECNFEGCSASFKIKKDLLRHASGHGDATYPCYICGKRFTRKDNLKRHTSKCSVVPD